jgi:hypothetical protein
MKQRQENGVALLHVWNEIFCHLLMLDIAPLPTEFHVRK